MSTFSLVENNTSSLGRRKVIDELLQGRDMANQLQSLLAKSDAGCSGASTTNSVFSVEDLLTKIMASFSNTLLMLNRNNEPDPDDDVVLDVVSPIQASINSRVDSPFMDARKSEDSGESCRSVSTTTKDRRGCYKRRKTSHTWKRESPNLIDDGHAWRKYGQKAILNAKHPRNYFRCTHKYDQGCQATKQVQKIEEDPPMFRTTYYGHHTCRNLLKAPELLLDCTSPSQDSSVFLSFNNANNNLSLAAKQGPAHPFFSSLSSVKQELKDNVTQIHNQASSSDYIVSPDHHDHNDDDDEHHDHLMAYDVLSSTLESDIHGIESFEDDVLLHMNF